MSSPYHLEITLTLLDTDFDFCLLHSCAQRVHQNTLENLTGFAFLTLFNGLFFPKVTAIISATWVISRIPYAIGYYSGTPSNRAAGAILSGLSFLGTSSRMCSTFFHTL